MLSRIILNVGSQYYKTAASEIPSCMFVPNGYIVCVAERLFTSTDQDTKCMNTFWKKGQIQKDHSGFLGCFVC